MYSDTHFHFQHLVENNSVDFGSEILSQMATKNCFFGMDIGTRHDDLFRRGSCLIQAIENIEDEVLQNRARKFTYLSAGIWPDVDSIHERYSRIQELEENINDFINDENILSNKIVAIGEGGIDHHWNPSGADGRQESDFDRDTVEGEKELFEMQLALAKKLNLPFIIHSRDAFFDTLDSIKNAGYDNGIVHCFSYGKDEAKAFLDRGWYISLSGAVTYAKKSNMDAMKEMIAYIPKDRLLVETDSPYLAPIPLRGTENNPVNIKYTYDFISSARNISTSKLCEIVDENIKSLFKI